jgi:hypothetical protein
MKLRWEKPEGDDWKAYETTQLAMMAFGKNAAPLAFTWLGWCALLALVRYVEMKTGLWPLTALKWILGLLLWSYFGTLQWGTNKVEWMSKEEALSKSALTRMVLSMIATGGLVAASYWFAEVFMQHPL